MHIRNERENERQKERDVARIDEINFAKRQSSEKDVKSFMLKRTKNTSLNLPLHI